MKTYNYSCEGKIYFYPKKYSNKAWAILNCEIGIIEYYSYWINKKLGLKLQKPKHGAHVTVIREEEIADEIYETIWTKNQNKTIQFEYSNHIETNGVHFWLPVKCEEMFDIREEMGLSRRDMEFGLHLTIGRVKDSDMLWFDEKYLK